ncbi:hypothetical protein Tco_0811144 [Tanacetum coccineum]
MALRTKIIVFGNSVASSAMAVRFRIGPAVMTTTSIAVGLELYGNYCEPPFFTSLSYKSLPSFAKKLMRTTTASATSIMDTTACSAFDVDVVPGSGITHDNLQEWASADCIIIHGRETQHMGSNGRRRILVVRKLNLLGANNRSCKVSALQPMLQVDLMYIAYHNN